MANKSRLIKTFMELVQIDSPTGEEDAMDQEVSNKLESLGFSVYHDSFKNVIASLPGIGEPIVAFSREFTGYEPAPPVVGTPDKLNAGL